MLETNMSPAATYSQNGISGTRSRRVFSETSDNLRFPLIESLLENGTVGNVIGEMKHLCGILDECPAGHQDLDMLNHIYTAGLGLKETIRLLEKLRELAAGNKK